MAKITINFDTTTKDLDVTMDGKAVPDVHSVNLSKGYYYDEDKDSKFSCSLMTLDSSKQKDEGYRYLTQITANDSTDATEQKAQGATAHPDHPTFLLLKKPLSTSIKGLIAPYRRKGR